MKGGISMNQDEQYLKMLSIFHYIVGGLVALFACFPIIHLFVGIAMLNGTLDGAPPFMGIIFVVLPVMFIIFGWIFAVCLIIAGTNLSKYEHHMFCLVIAAISCTFFPFGTVLGVFTIIVLLRPSVKELFHVKT